MISDTLWRDRSGEARLLRRLDLAVGRAMVDRTYAASLLTDPSETLGASECDTARRTELGAIRAHTVRDFARQAEALLRPGSGGRCAVADRPARAS